jgi:hypothetical protein
VGFGQEVLIYRFADQQHDDPAVNCLPETDSDTGLERLQIVDGQQRLTTIHDFLKGNFSLGTEADVEYADNVGALIQGREFKQLPPEIQRQIKRYVLNIITLPKDLDLSLRLEIFRRINEAGVPLSPHDLRLAVFGRSDRVYFIRLAGVFDPAREGAIRMIEAAKEKHALEYPWVDGSVWKDWWIDSAQAAGQAPSQMFLYYVLARDLENVEKLLASSKVQVGSSHSNSGSTRSRRPRCHGLRRTLRRKYLSSLLLPVRSGALLIKSRRNSGN